MGQLQHDYILGNYPVGRDDAAQLSALQILVEIGFVVAPDSCTYVVIFCSRLVSTSSLLYPAFCSILFKCYFCFASFLKLFPLVFCLFVALC